MTDHKDEIIEMALSDKVSFDAIKDIYGLDQNQVKRLMRSELKPGSYRAWRKRVDTALEKTLESRHRKSGQPYFFRKE